MRYATREFDAATRPVSPTVALVNITSDAPALAPELNETNLLCSRTLDFDTTLLVKPKEHTLVRPDSRQADSRQAVRLAQSPFSHPARRTPRERHVTDRPLQRQLHLSPATGAGGVPLLLPRCDAFGLPAFRSFRLASLAFTLANPSALALSPPSRLSRRALQLPLEQARRGHAARRSQRPRDRHRGRPLFRPGSPRSRAFNP